MFVVFVVMVYVVEGKGTRCSKFVRGASEDDVVKCVVWWCERMDEGCM